jgi:hypothetical protein
LVITSTLTFKLALTPLLMTGATYATRRWGPAVGGWIVGLPLTSGPISLFLALERGVEFAAEAAVATILGINGVTATVVTYALLARRWHWATTTSASVVAFIVLAWLLRDVTTSAPVAFGATIAALAASLALLPRGKTSATVAKPLRWDLPLRIAVALTMVLAVTAAAERLGPQLSGLISPFPVFTIVLAVFSHRESGGAVAAPYSRGLLLSLVGFAVFFLVVALLLVHVGIAATFVLATIASLAASVGLVGLVRLVGRVGRVGLVGLVSLVGLVG